MVIESAEMRDRGGSARINQAGRTIIASVDDTNLKNFFPTPLPKIS